MTEIGIFKYIYYSEYKIYFMKNQRSQSAKLLQQTKL